MLEVEIAIPNLNLGISAIFANFESRIGGVPIPGFRYLEKIVIVYVFDYYAMVE